MFKRRILDFRWLRRDDTLLTRRRRSSAIRKRDASSAKSICVRIVICVTGDALEIGKSGAGKEESAWDDFKYNVWGDADSAKGRGLFWMEWLAGFFMFASSWPKPESFLLSTNVENVELDSSELIPKIKIIILMD